MKKIIPFCYFAILLYCFVKFLFPSPAYAAPCPPLGTNIAANFDRENLEWLAQHANCTGPIPITVIITPAMVQNPNILIDIQNNLRELNFNPTWRPWGFVDPDNAQELNAWIDTFSLLEIGQLQAWNEWNRYKEAGTLDPARDARVVQALINARNQGLINIPIGNTPLDLLNYTDMNYRDYWTRFNQACPGCLNQLDFIVSNVYAPSQYGPNSVNEFLNVWLGELNFLKSLGVNLDNKFFVISEAGLAPGVYANFEERLRDTLLFAQALEAAILANPNLFPGLDQITFLLMNDDTGVIYLIYRECDDQGNCVWKVREYLEYNFNVPGSPFTSFSSLQCTPQSSGARDSRPDACDPCNVTSYLSSSCATTFTVHDVVSYERWEGDPEEPHCVLEDWGGMVVIDPSSTTIPFVGKKESEDEQLYLADYFEGTNEYYQDYSQYWLDWVNHAGVYRKLTPMGYQDELKKEMVERATEQTSELRPGGVHDYNVSYKGRLCWDIPFLADALLSLATNYGLGNDPAIKFISDRAHFCAYSSDYLPFSLNLRLISTAINTFNRFVPFGFLKISTWGHLNDEAATLTQLNGNFPPEPDEEDYVEKWRDWKNSEWGKLWEAVPMFSRNDTPGDIAPYIGVKSADQPKYIPPQIEKVPHLARLFEETLELNELLLPEGTAGAPKFVQNQGEETLLASAESNVLGQEAGTNSCSSNKAATDTNNTAKVLGEKTLLAQGEGSGCFHIEPISQVHFQPDKSALVFVTIKVHSDGGDGHIQLHINGASQGTMWGWNKAGGPFVINPEYTQSPIAIPLGICSSISYGVRIDECGDAKWQNITCDFCLEAEGSLVTNCGPGEGLENEVCEIWGPVPVNDCFKDAIKDTNPNDDLCCKPIAVDLRATDAFINKQYLPCGTTGEYSCKPVEVLPGVTETVCRDHCHDDIIEAVNRRFGINLAHPYLNEIWNLSTNSETYGIFNIFRPAEIPPFEDLDASSEVNYSYIDTSLPPGGSVTPGTGEFYFNHLGGVQKAKEWVTTKVLMPYVEQ